jgi:heme exporter protein C
MCCLGAGFDFVPLYLERMIKFLKRHIYKVLAVLLIGYSIIAGFLIEVPDLPVIRQSIRNLFYHVPMWFSMIAMLAASVFFAIRYLRGYDLKYDLYSLEAGKVGMLLGILGILTGMAWAHYAWGRFWVNDPKLNGAALSLLIYTAWLLLRNSIREPHQRARFAAVYSIFAFVLMILFIGILPRLAEESLHPGKDGNPALAVGSLDDTMRRVFLPAVLGWILFAAWITSLRIRYRSLRNEIDEIQNELLN